MLLHLSLRSVSTRATEPALCGMAALWLLLILAAKVYDADADADDTFLCLFVDLMVVVVVQMT